MYKEFSLKITILLALVGFFSLEAQQVIVQGKITDSLQNPLAYANILAIPDSDAVDISFAITEENGNYKK